jgi:hypothetical protein
MFLHEAAPMDISIPIAPGMDLKIADRPQERGDYATSSLPKGFLLVADGLDLAEEAVGFGFPVVKRGLQTLFPGRINLRVDHPGPIWSVRAVYTLNLVEKISRVGTKAVENRLLYGIKNFMAELIRRLPMSRGLLTAISSRLREMFHWETVYADTGFSTEVKVIYTLAEETGKVLIEIDTTSLPPEISEVVVMNELGAHHFDHYQDSSGASLQGRQIGCWDELYTEEAWFESRARQVAFRLSQVEGTRLFRGWELVGSRLAWAGFGYAFPPSLQRLRYVLKIERLA